MQEDGDSRPAGLQDLTRPAHLLVWAMRAIAVGREDCSIVIRTFRAACGVQGDATLQAYGVFVKYVALTARKKLQVHVPGCPCVGCDEMAMVEVVGAAQSSLHDLNEGALDRGLHGLTGRPPDESLKFVAQSVARLLLEAGLEIIPPTFTLSGRRTPPDRAVPYLLN